MNEIELGTWKLRWGKSFCSYTRNLSRKDIDEILSFVIRYSGYKVPLVLREMRNGNVIVDVVSSETLTMRRIIVNRRNGLSVVSDEPIEYTPELKKQFDEEEIEDFTDLIDNMWNLTVLAEDYIESLGFKDYRINHHGIFAASFKSKGDEIDGGVVIHHSYTRPFVEYLYKEDNVILITDEHIRTARKLAKELKPPEGFELHAILTNECTRYMYFITQGEKLVMLPPQTTPQMPKKIKVPTRTHGVLRTLTVDATNIDEILKRLDALEIDANRYFIYDNISIAFSDNKKYVINYEPPKLEVKNI